MRVLSTLLALVLLTGCNLFDNEQSIPQKFVGEWEWTLTAGGWSHPVSADTAGYGITLIIYSQNTAEWYRNDSLITNFRIEEGKKSWKDGSFLMRPTSDHQCSSRLTHMPENNELRVSSANCTDLPTFYFRKAAR